jgi:hypothetical protein
MALIARAAASRAILAIALSCISAGAFAQTPGDTRGPAGATNVGGPHMGCDRLCWQPDPYHPVGSFTCVYKLATQAEVDGYSHSVSAKDIAVGKSILLSSGPVTSGVTCGSREDIPVWGYVRAQKILSMEPPPFKINQVVNILVTGVEPNQKESFFFPDPNTKDAIKPSADADNK